MVLDTLDTATANPAAQQAYRQLERMIVTLELAPGSHTTEGSLNERLGLGRTPVREAIQRLAWEGFFEIRPRAGVTVAPLHPSDWLRVIDARRGVEVLLASSAARLMTNSHKPVLEAAGDAMRTAVAAEDVHAFMQADKSMDEAVALIADNSFAARLAAPLQTHSRRFWFRFQATSGLTDAGARHLGLLDAIRSCDEARARLEAEQLMDMLRAHAKTAATR